MSVKQISSRIELSFWQITISLLTQSSSFQKLVRWFYLIIMPKSGILFQNFDHHRVFRWAAVGLVLGLIIGFLIAFF
jgi:hypothetical protein